MVYMGLLYFLIVSAYPRFLPLQAAQLRTGFIETWNQSVSNNGVNLIHKQKIIAEFRNSVWPNTMSKSDRLNNYI